MPSVEGTLVTHCSAAVFPCDIELDEGGEGVWLEMFHGVGWLEAQSPICVNTPPRA